ncbi:MAG: SDR family oxidoreductase [Pseudomonadota bacterium]
MEHPTTIVLGLGLESGLAVARRFHDASHNVLVADHQKSRVEKAQGELPDVVETRHYERDELVHNAFADAETSFGRLDHLILIPPIAEPDTLVGFDSKSFGEGVAAGVLMQADAMRDFAERVLEQDEAVGVRAEQKRQRGSITMILSLAAHLSQPGQFTATVLQGAAEAMVRSAALELAPDAIRVNAICALRPRAERREGSGLSGRTPMGRTASSDEIAEAAFFLSDERVAIVTGETLVLDGGRSRLSGTLFTLGGSGGS